MEKRYFARTDKGCKRKKNEDRYSISPFGDLFIITDGMGGHAGGEIASKIAVDSLEDFISKVMSDEQGTLPFDLDENLSYEANLLKIGIKLANKKIYKISRENIKYGRMGTTIVAALIKEDKAYIAHVGDSRAYLIRDNNIYQLTQDHSWVNLQISLGILNKEEAANHPLKNVIIRALGTQKDIEVDLTEQKLLDDDYLLLCSDGLNLYLSDSEILQIVEEGGEDLEKIVNKLVDLANARGGEDNITVILIHFKEPPEKRDDLEDEEVTQILDQNDIKK